MVDVAQTAPETIYPDAHSQLLASIEYVNHIVRFALFCAKLNESSRQTGQGLYISSAEIEQIAAAEIGQHAFSLPSHPSQELNHTLAQWLNQIQAARQQWLERSAASSSSLPLNHLAHEFGLGVWEVTCLLLALAPEIDARFGQMFAYLQNDISQQQPTINLLLNLLTDQLHNKIALRPLFAPHAILQAAHLLHIPEGAATTQLAQPVTVKPAVIDFLLGSRADDEQIRSAVSYIMPTQQQAVPNQAVLESTWAERPIYAFVGGYGVGKRAAAAQVALLANQPMLIADCKALSELPIGFDAALQPLLRDGRLNQAVLLLKNWDTLLVENRPSPTRLEQLLAYPHIVITMGAQSWLSAEVERQRPILTLNFGQPDRATRLALWQAALPNAPFNLEPIAAGFALTQGQIRDVSNMIRDWTMLHNQPPTIQDALAACRRHSNQRLAKLAVKVTPRYSWRDIILPTDTHAQLQEAVNMVKRRHVVYEQWGFDSKMSLGKGMNALFVGDPGTGKTMAAEIIANELGLDLYKIDLSMIVDKYIGETEKNIGRIFDEAATSNAILFFDEADAIFGKRGEVKSSHDRHANIEVSYLLQRVDAFDGVVILATNLRANIDEAFTRRLHFAIQFPFPQAADRERIWRVTFPAATPLAEDIDFRLLAERFELSGGNIRNIVLAAAFLAAKMGATCVTMDHLLQATRREHQKMGHLINERLFMTM